MKIVKSASTKRRGGGSTAGSSSAVSGDYGKWGSSPPKSWFEVLSNERFAKSDEELKRRFKVSAVSFGFQPVDKSFKHIIQNCPVTVIVISLSLSLSYFDIIM